MILKWLLIFSWLSSSWGSVYEIVRFEASDYRDYTFEELTDLLGVNQWLLPHLECDGKKEYDPFSPPVRKNQFKNSLKILSLDSTQTLTYQNGRTFDPFGQEVFQYNDSFIKSALASLKRFEQLPSGRRLLRLLEESYFPLTIKRGGNNFNPRLLGGVSRGGHYMSQSLVFLTTLRMGPVLEHLPFSDIGVGGEINWNPDSKLETIEEDGIKRGIHPDLILAHEMYHAFDSIRGMLDSGFVKGEDLAFTQVTEYRGVFFENLMRKEMKLKLRKFYGEPHAPEGEDPMQQPDLLGPDGEPIFIPSNCLR